ncbi:hypothetical protein BO83DRAFT_397000 [Aspergillus eucalypticola CBS 122712]|uniref:non-specific serine/threonine protein kinase n=1 Tax=Aspergillus eucalypticola (strain CBS 122712 / IBT 29274) TaxID=1448314 RepID=A0A317W182_ASPEC|nr:uncharacterized protein BO83DRAFT_397000 [Aspergillus eucalypticola CBS 122712]PWY79022.1 hypothetical protein BO83DRAFT_397000 [Aspergillus eucalypticola CBS 122712]
MTWRYCVQPQLSRRLHYSRHLFTCPLWPVEEETLPWYSPEIFYPVRVVVGKLGYGGYSTIWLSRDLCKCVTLKVLECNSPEAQREMSAYDHLTSLNVPDHAGAKLIRKALDSFQIASEKGTFGCLVHPPLGMSLHEFRTQLRARAGIVHTDIQAKNIMMGIEDPSILSHFEEEERSNPSPRKFAGDREIYTSRNLRNTKPSTNPKWQQTWDIFQQGHLFYGRGPNQNPSDAHHLAEMVAIMGLPPKEMVQNSTYATTFFDAEDIWKGAVEVPTDSLEKLEGNLQGQPQQLSLRFLREALKWIPNERKSARELLADPWLRSS